AGHRSPIASIGRDGASALLGDERSRGRRCVRVRRVVEISAGALDYDFPGFVHTRPCKTTTARYRTRCGARRRVAQGRQGAVRLTVGCPNGLVVELVTRR